MTHAVVGSGSRDFDSYRTSGDETGAGDGASGSKRYGAASSAGGDSGSCISLSWPPRGVVAPLPDAGVTGLESPVVQPPRVSFRHAPTTANTATATTTAATNNLLRGGSGDSGTSQMPWAPPVRTASAQDEAASIDMAATAPQTRARHAARASPTRSRIAAARSPKLATADAFATSAWHSPARAAAVAHMTKSESREATPTH